MAEADGFDQFPDSETLVQHVVRTTVNPEHGVHSSVPRSYKGGPMVLVKRLGGIPVHRAALDAPEIQFDCYGLTKTEARILAQTTRIEVWKKMGTVVTHPSGHSGFISGVEDSQGLTYLPDPTDPPRDRYIIGLRLFMRKV